MAVRCSRCSNLFPVYHVTVEGDVEGKTTKSLGYATGASDDIRAVYGAENYQGFHLVEINVLGVTHDLALGVDRARVKKMKLESELLAIKRQLREE